MSAIAYRASFVRRTGELVPYQAMVICPSPILACECFREFAQVNGVVLSSVIEHETANPIFHAVTVL